MACTVSCARDLNLRRKKSWIYKSRAKLHSLPTVQKASSDAAISEWVEESANKFGGIDIVVSKVSALAIPDTDENWSESIEVDLMGAVRLVKASVPYLEKSTAPSIVAISTVSGREADLASGPDGTVKTAMIGYIAGIAF